MSIKEFNNWFKIRYTKFNDLAHESAIAISEINLLVEKINKWNSNYYIHSHPTISDDQYDSAIKLLVRWEKKFPQYRDAKSPTMFLNVPIDPFDAKPHPEKMLSIQNAFVIKDVVRFLGRCSDVNITGSSLFTLEPKIDGVSIELFYKGSLLKHALTRGDGDVGLDVSANLHNALQIPKKINFREDIIIRGELYIATNVINTYQTELRNKSKVLSQRNVVSGLIQRKRNEYKNTYWYFYTKYLKAKIRFFPYYIVDAARFKIVYQSDIHFFLSKIGFETVTYHRTANTLSEIKKYYEDIVNWGCPFEMDGIVIKVNQISDYSRFSKSTKFHKWMIAWKFVEKIARSKIMSYEVTVGRTGKITYVANIIPVLIDGSIVRRVMLNNFSHILRSEYFVRSVITLKKAGGIIPKIISVNNKTTKNLILIQKAVYCPSCGWILFDDMRSANYFEEPPLYIQKCLNWNCARALIEKIVFFCSRAGLNIKNISIHTIAKLFKQKKIRNIIDLYQLADNPTVLAKALGSDLIANKLIKEIEISKKTTSLATIMQAIGVNNIGAESWKLLVDAYGDWSRLKNATHIELEVIFRKSFNTTSSNQTISKKAQLVFDFLSNYDNILFVDTVISLFNNITISSHDYLTRVQTLKNQRVAVTGKFQFYSRVNLINIIRSNGGIYSTNVTKGTSILISDGETNSRKFVNAKKFQIRILKINDFCRFLAEAKNEKTLVVKTQYRIATI